MTRKILVDGAVVWCKTYDGSGRGRRVVTRVWNRLIRPLGVSLLHAPPRRAGESARQLEQRRITQLHAQGVPVPRIVGEGYRMLLLGDLGPSLSSCLKRARDDRAIDVLVERGARALVEVHRRGAYLGQAVARNMAVGTRQIGFLDFEEDPLEIMSLREAQARDWLLFNSSVARYYEGRVDVLAGIFGQALPEVGNEVVMTVNRTARRLEFLERATRGLGQRARALGVAVASLRRSALVWLVGMVLLLDFITDGDSDILQALQQLM